MNTCAIFAAIVIIASVFITSTLAGFDPGAQPDE